MKKTTVDDVLKAYLEGEGLGVENADKLIKKFHGCVKAQKYLDEAEVESEPEPKIRSGTSCFGILNRKGGKDNLVFEM